MKTIKGKNYDEFKSAQDILYEHFDIVTSSMIGGLNWRLEGYNEHDFDWKQNDYASYRLCDDMIKAGLIFYVEPFKCKCGSHRYTYGGGWACDDCFNCVSTPDWWKVKIQQDGNAFICKGNGFVDLQESGNFAYGSTKEEAKENYRMLFIPQPVS